MIKRINNETVKFLNDSKMYTELGAYQMEITNSGGITYNAVPGQHDDTIMASAFALNEIHKLETNGNYTVSFARSSQQKHRLREKWN